ncbi:MAG: arginine--tRNA ligase, partial [Verrucomicrobiota bacterium]
MAQTIPTILQSRVADAISKTSKAADLPDDFSVSVVPTQDPKFGDYQCNAAMVLAKRLKTNPREFAAEVIEHLETDDLIDPPEIAGPGFLNFRLKSEVIAKRLIETVQDERLGVPLVENPETIVIDFSAPNVAKQMHVGPIRSTIIGDCLARVSRFLGHNVITDNHIGDWGTQFGMGMYGWKKMLDAAALKQDPITELLR